ncbi:MAG: DUF177 domain-containing protein [Dehalococcoidia bacterium]|nr:DUF177 domain-containing protein [Dehalococcoidia bacterium]
MQINVAQLLKEPVGAKRNYEIDGLAGENGENHVKGNIELMRTSRGILAEGRFSVDIKGSCSRCLAEVKKRISFIMEEEFFPVIDIVSGAHLNPPPDEFAITDNHILDLSEAIRQYIIMTTPTRLLCRPDCPGICPICGQELARGDCGHSSRPRDSRWDKLTQLEKESKI